jgi:hypothetical protein
MHPSWRRSNLRKHRAPIIIASGDILLDLSPCPLAARSQISIEKDGGSLAEADMAFQAFVVFDHLVSSGRVGTKKCNIHSRFGLAGALAPE